ncbi:DUF2959 domain-containing protein [Psychrobium sp. 1_MG-2023]|uniref:DUF2959 domain-containing protein n=1 Tax=Psychrobium sp. 1_MG-2023 TaxID=3062624 RepID=UPI000C341AEC|nr:DUF2959 domain-containing protein [Psychrobium sp. 1_MG-2023]MDP2560388.1 DUF2959 domain-containing protein [Psychrobium sp. 1_MG-2023]PKF57943.1 DUF2959 domain-containing protein [Alteromonadales bacterium alter-6D02]
MLKSLIISVALFSLVGCQTAMYSAMEKVGFHKRDILVDRVEDARDAQDDAQQQFTSALDELSTLINFDGGDIEDVYNTLNDQYIASQDAADNVSKRIGKIEHVAAALFDEWEEEITQYTSDSFKRSSQQQLRSTKRSYAKLVKSMRRSESKMAPVLNSLKDNVLYLKHNLNASAINAIGLEFKTLQKEIKVLVNEVNSSIAESNKFIEQLNTK